MKQPNNFFWLLLFITARYVMAQNVSKSARFAACKT